MSVTWDEATKIATEVLNHPKLAPVRPFMEQVHRLATIISYIGANYTEDTKVWECKIGGKGVTLPLGADLPMREAVEKAYRQLTGKEADFNFSGWGAELTEGDSSSAATECGCTADAFLSG